MPFYERQPLIQPLHTLIEEVIRGEILIPRFQRPGTELTWDTEKRGDLLDSIYRGFPIGTILLWSTDEPIQTMTSVGGVRVPSPASADVRKRLLLDGHQRLSTLVQIFGQGIVNDSDSDQASLSSEDQNDPHEVWLFDLETGSEVGNRSRDRFVVQKPQEQKLSDLRLPLSLTFSRPKLNKWIRERNLTDDQVQLVDGLRDRFWEFSMPVAVLGASSLDEAAESFKRINSSGTPMSDFHMVAALAYMPSLDIQAVFATEREEHLVPTGWDDLDDLVLLRVCAGLTKMSPSKFDVGDLARRLRTEPGLVNEAFSATAKAALVFGKIGVAGPRALPYIWQLIALSIQIRELEDQFEGDHSWFDAIERWFWLTTYGGVFAGVNSAVYKRAVAAMMSLARGDGHESMERDMLPKIGEIPRFHFSNARAKACALAMARFEDRGQPGKPARTALADGARSLQTLDPRGRKSDWWNRVVVTPRTGIQEYRDALRRRADGEPAESIDNELLSRIGISADSRGGIEEILEERRRKLVDEEKDFVEGLDLVWE